MLFLGMIDGGNTRLLLPDVGGMIDSRDTALLSWLVDGSAAYVQWQIRVCRRTD